MHRWPFSALIILAFLKCSTFRSYLANRALDTADVLTFSVEQKVAGVNVKPCFSNIGLQFAQSGQGFGLRAGSIGAYSTGANNKFYNSGNSYLLINSIHHYPVQPHFRNNKIKAFSESNSLAVGIFDWHGYNFVTQCEVSVGLYYGIRTGFNIAELGDWLLGWLTIDFLNDDIY